MTPRYLGCAAIISRSFARIHETNLKKQGILTLNFEDLADYNRILEDDLISIIGLEELSPGKPITCILYHKDGTEEVLLLKHSYNESQLEWFRSGSALNMLRSAARG
jgi:aconitate hydratase